MIKPFFNQTTRSKGGCKVAARWLQGGCKAAARWLQGVYMLRMTSTKSFLYQTIHSIVMIENPNAP